MKPSVNFLISNQVGGSQDFPCPPSQKTPTFRLVIQDLPAVIEDAPNSQPEDLSPGFSFMAHDFRTPQPAYDTGTYFFRWVFHN
jgi:hypothetical protein